MASTKPRRQVNLGYEGSENTDDNGSSASSQSPAIPFADFAVLPEAGDNAGIARRVVPGGTRVILPAELGGNTITLNHTILEGHRFAVKSIVTGERLLSWGLTFGEAVSPIEPGQYLANERVIKALRGRGFTDLPETHNFVDLIVAHTIDEAKFQSAEQVPEFPASELATFMGFPRDAARGIGTRNYIALIGTTSLTAGFVKTLESRVKEALPGLAADFPNVDGIVAIAHTEGGGQERPHNFDLLVTTLTHFIVHPNCAAVLICDYGNEAVTCADLTAHAAKAGLPLQAVPHKFLTLSGNLENDIDTGLDIVKAWLPTANACVRSPQPASALSIAQQCGGSDAFSGVSGNPCAGEACKLLIQHGGQAVLAETDELMGAESYILRKVKDLPTAQKFLGVINAFKDRLAWHGQSAEANPSGGNNYRGLYNIGLKSLGAAKKKHADVRLDGVLAYGERTVDMGRGYFMMDSPGNDLESIAGQVATGCNLIYFITGNGSITNFPLVPTIKIVTTSERFALLSKDMDFNAGRYQEGTPMPALGQELFDITLRCASGERSVGERAGHAQVSIWRNWPQAGPGTDVAKLYHGNLPGKAIHFKRTEQSDAQQGGAVAPVPFPAYHLAGTPLASAVAGGADPIAIERIGLILPTSLCSGEVARQITKKLNGLVAAGNSVLGKHVSRFECLPHTEGCGTGYPDGGIALYERIMAGHLLHSSVRFALCLEHGCEKTHNDFFHGTLSDLGIDASNFGFASIQLDGGIESVTDKVLKYFDARAAAEESRVRCDPADCNTGKLNIGIMVKVPSGSASAALPPEIGALAMGISKSVVDAGGCVIIPSTSPLLTAPALADALDICGSPAPSIAFGQAIRPSQGVGVNGIHIMDMPSVVDWTESVTGLVAAGAHVVLALSVQPSGSTKVKAVTTPGHPMVPVVHIGVNPTSGAPTDPAYASVADVVLTPATGDVSAWAAASLAAVAEVAAGTRRAKASSMPFFSITRGHVGVST